jgi:hypothetical protein
LTPNGDVVLTLVLDDDMDDRESAVEEAHNRRAQTPLNGPIVRGQS